MGRLKSIFNKIDVGKAYMVVLGRVKKQKQLKKRQNIVLTCPTIQNTSLIQSIHDDMKNRVIKLITKYVKNVWRDIDGFKSIFDMIDIRKKGGEAK